MKRRDPWRGANGRPKAVADLALSGEDAELNHRRVCTWFAGRWRNHQSKRAEKPHSKFRRSNARNGPATRPETPLAVENSVGKPAALARGCAQCRHGKESMANSHHPLPCPSAARLAGTFVFSLQSVFVIPLFASLKNRNAFTKSLVELLNASPVGFSIHRP